MDLKSKYTVCIIGGLCLAVGITIIAIKCYGMKSNKNNKPSNNSVGSISGNSSKTASGKGSNKGSSPSNYAKNSTSNSTNNSTSNSTSNNTNNSTSNSTNNSTNNSRSNGTSNNTEGVDNNLKASNDPTVSLQNQNNQDINKKQPETKKDDQPVGTKEASPSSPVPLSQDKSSKKVNTPPTEKNKSQQAHEYDNLTKEQLDDVITKTKKEMISLGISESEKKEIFAEFENITLGLSHKDAAKKLYELKEKKLKEQQEIKKETANESSWISNKSAGFVNGVKATVESLYEYFVRFFNMVYLNLKALKGRSVNISNID